MSKTLHFNKSNQILERKQHIGHVERRQINYRHLSAWDLVKLHPTTKLAWHLQHPAIRKLEQNDQSVYFIYEYKIEDQWEEAQLLIQTTEKAGQQVLQLIEEVVQNYLDNHPLSDELYETEKEARKKAEALGEPLMKKVP